MTEVTAAQREELAKVLEKTKRLYDLLEAAALTGRHRQQLQRWISADKITVLKDQQQRPWRYRIPARQLAEIIRVGPYGRPAKVPWKPLEELRREYGHRIKD